MVSTSKHSKVGQGCCSYKYSKIPEAEKRGLYYLLLGQNKYCLLNAGWWWCAGRRGPERKCAGPDRILWMEGGQPGHARGRPALVHCTHYISISTRKRQNVVWFVWHFLSKVLCEVQLMKYKIHWKRFWGPVHAPIYCMCFRGCTSCFTYNCIVYTPRINHGCK